jgi:SAM-dependent methyltransferase
MAEPRNRASKEFWEGDYYSGVALPARPSDAFAPERCLAAGLSELAPMHGGQTLMEVGCAPGRWLVWYAERFGAVPTGIEYTDAGVELTRRNLAAAGVDGRVVPGDFFEPDLLDEQFDVVLSLGFIEHFDDLSRAFARHVDFIAPGGRLALGVPNFRGLIGMLQRWGDPGFLALHNLAAMDPALYRRLAADHGLTFKDVRYLDPLDPDMIRLRRRGPGLVTVPLRQLRRLRSTDAWNHRALSTWLLMTFERPA